MLSRSPLTYRFRLVTLALAGASFLLACASADNPKAKKRTPADPGDDFFGEEATPYEQPIQAQSEPDSGAFGAASRPANAKDAGEIEAGTDGGTIGPKTYCTGPLAKGDLSIVEILIASRTGSSDDAEWVEIASTRECWLKLKGVSIESPRGTAADSATINEDFELAPKASFLVAGSVDPAKNHALPGKVFSWEATDVLKNDGDTISVKAGALVIDALTYPSLANLTPGRSLAFPSDCQAAVRSEWARWSLTFSTYGGGAFKGTPNGPNTDVACF